uniref:Ankyrin repeat and SOCS box protein 6 n=1 Tax=Esox lucius TaxID=8010 RepID=C1BWX8_ESOLU|nr:Ankyrin repeat and SOCS box protein 6 [Esox lucius]
MLCLRWLSEDWSMQLKSCLDPVSYYNPLHIAVLRNKPNMVRMLAEHGADINKRDRIHESSPLDLASEEAERVPCMRTLLDMGADVNAKDKHGKSPLLHALASSDGLTVHNIENIRLLLQRGTVLYTHTHTIFIYKS